MKLAPQQRSPDAVEAAHTRMALVLAVPLAVGFAVLCQWPVWEHSPPLLVVNVAASVAFIITAMLLDEEAGQRDTAWMFGIAGALWSGARLGWNADVLALLSSMAESLFWVFLAWSLLRYPQGRLTRSERLYMIVMFTLLPGLEVVFDLTRVQRVEAIARVDPAIWLPALRPLRSVPVEGSPRVMVVGYTALGLVFMALMLRRLVRARGVDRRVLFPVLVAAGMAAFAGGVGWAVYQFSDSPRLVEQTLLCRGWRCWRSRRRSRSRCCGDG